MRKFNFTFKVENSIDNCNDIYLSLLVKVDSLSDAYDLFVSIIHSVFSDNFDYTIISVSEIV